MKPPDATRPPGQSNPLAGIALMLTGIFFFALNDAMGKYLVGTYSVGQILLVRSIAAMILLAPFIKREGLAPFIGMPRPWLQLPRAVFATFEVACFYWALTDMSLADVMTFYLAAPIYVTAVSPFLLREKVGWRRWAAVFVGFVGVMIALKPTTGAFTPGALIAIAGSFSFSIFIVCTRLVRGSSGIVLVTIQNAAALVFGAVMAPLSWVAMGWFDGALLALLGLVAMIAYLCMNKALDVAEASVVVPYQYSTIFWAILLGYIFFGDIPSVPMLIGAGIIIGAGIYIFIREQQLAKASSFAEPPP
jgi:drug/metabolite transporter (DMT)-like permease